MPMHEPATKPDAQRRQILSLEAATSALEPSDAQRLDWQAAADASVNRFMAKVNQHPTYQLPDADLLGRFDQQVASAEGLEQLLRVVEDGMTAAGILTAGPGHLAYVPGGGLYVGAVADHLAAAVNAFTADHSAAPVAAAIHAQTIQWLAAMVGYGEGAFGDVTSGGSHATLTAFFVARHAFGIRARDYDKTCVYLSEHTHHCCEKALRVLFGDDLCLRKVPLANQAIDAAALGAMVDADLKHGLKPWMIVATAGSTNLGRVDPLRQIAAVAKDYSLWFHVDGAYGGFFNLCDEVKERFHGLAEADSVVLDPHKGMFLPYGCGAVVFKRGESLRQALDHSGAYLQDRAGLQQKSAMDYSLELTRPFRSLRIWLALKVYGAPLFKQALSEKLLLAAYCRDQLATIPGVEIVSGLDLSIFAFRYVDSGRSDGDLDAFNKLLMQRINAHPEAFLSSTLVDGRFVLRVAILSFRTHLKTVDRLIATVRAEVGLLTQQGGAL